MENSYIGRKVRHLSRAIKKTVDAEYLTKVNLGVTVEEGMVIMKISQFEGKAQTQDLLSILRVSKSTLSELLASLEKKGYIVYAQSSSDKRKKNIVLTKQGKEHVERAKKAFADFEARLTSGISEEDLVVFERIYLMMLANIGESSL